jgi:hypothetical protein
MGYLPGYRGYIPQGNRVPAALHSDHLTVVAAGMENHSVSEVPAQATAAENASAASEVVAAGQLGVGQEVAVELPDADITFLSI